MFELVAPHQSANPRTSERSPCDSSPPIPETSRISTESMSSPVRTRRRRPRVVTAFDQVLPPVEVAQVELPLDVDAQPSQVPKYRRSPLLTGAATSQTRLDPRTGAVARRFDARCPEPAGGAILLLLFWSSRTLDDLSASPWKVLGRTICDGCRSTVANGKAAGQSPYAHNCQRTSTMGDRFRFNV